MLNWQSLIRRDKFEKQQVFLVCTGTGVFTQIRCAQAGADIIDCCIDSMSGTTSQPSMGAIVHVLQGTENDTGIDPYTLSRLNTFWEQTRCVHRKSSTLQFKY